MFKKLSYATYLFFASFSTYAFLMTTLAYQLFTLDITNLTRKVRIIEKSKQAENVLKHDKHWKYVVFGLIIVLLLAFSIDYAIEVGKQDVY